MLGAQAIKTGTAEIKNLASAEKLKKFFGRFYGEVRKWNMSLEDWASRICVAVAVYFPQFLFSLGLFSSLKHDKASKDAGKNPSDKQGNRTIHFFETNGRNIVLWVLNLVIARMVKDDKIGVNTLLNQFMQPRITSESISKNLEVLVQQRKSLEDKLKDMEKHAPPGTGKTKARRSLERNLDKLNNRITKQMNLQKILASGGKLPLLQRLFNPLRLGDDYFEILKACGIQFQATDRFKAFWSSLDKNQLDLILKKLAELKAKDPAALNEVEQGLIKRIPGFMNRMNAFRLLSTAIIAGMTIYIIGVMAIDIVMKYIAPLDHDFDPTKLKGYQPKTPASGNRLQPPSFHQPGTFSHYFQSPKVSGGVTNA